MNQLDIFKSSLPLISQFELKYSSGFLVSKPERWVPTIGNFWLRFLDVLQVDFKLLSIKPSFNYTNTLDEYYLGKSEDNHFALAFSSNTSKYLADLIYGEIDPEVAQIGTEYLAYRFFSSIAQSWSGRDLSDLKFIKHSNSIGFDPIASIKIEASINSKNCYFEILLDELLVAKLDGLWSRQTSTIQFGNLQSQACHLRFSLFEESKFKLESGEVLDLDPSFDFASLDLIQGGRRLSSQLCQREDKFVVKVESQASEDSLSSSMVEVVTPEFQITADKTNLLGKTAFFVSTGLDLNVPLLVKRDGEVLAEASFVSIANQIKLEIK